MSVSGTKGNSSFPVLKSTPASTLAIAVLYAVAAKVSFLVTIPPGDISPIFPPAGIALAAVLILGRSALLGVWLGSFVANTIPLFAGRVLSDHGVFTALPVGALVGFGATCGAGAGAFLVRRLCNDEPPLYSGLNVLRLVGAGAVGSCMISPTIGVFSLSLGGYTPWDRFAYSWITWWVGDTAGAIVTAPLILAWFHQPPCTKHPWRILEAAALGGVTLLVCQVVFFHGVPFAYSLLPLLLWAAFRFGMRGTTTTAAVIALFATVGAYRGSSPFTRNTMNESLLFLHSFLAVDVVCPLFLAGILEERKRAEAALQHESGFSHAVINSLPGILYCYDENLRFLRWNNNFERVTGYTAEEIARLGPLDLFAEEEKSLVAERIREVFGKGASDVEADFVVKDGTRIPYYFTGLTTEIDGKPHLVGVGIDISVRKRAEEAERLSHERLRRFVDANIIGVVIANAEGSILEANDYYLRLTGFTREEFDQGKVNWRALTPPEWKHVDDQAIENFRQRGTSKPYEKEYVLRDGTRVPILLINTLLPGPEEQIAAFVLDLTERKEAEAKLRESEGKYRELVENANSIIMHWGRDGRVIFLNEFGLRFFGFTEAEICGRNLVGTIVPEIESSGRSLHKMIDEILANPAAFEQNVNENVRRNGERVWIAWTNKTVLDQKGEVAEILSIGLDITARKRAEEELRATQAGLEQRVLERTAELAAARDRAESADRVKSAFLATMSHELRTPLNSIIGFTGLVLQGLAGPLNAEQAKQIGMVKTSGQHLLALINDVLDISKIEAGQIEIASAPFNLRESIQKVVDTVTPLSDRKRLPLVLRIAPEVGEINSDRRRVEQILLNLLSNAIKFTEQGAITLTAEILPGPPPIPGSALRLAVADTGSGIKGEDLEKLFQPFRQLDTGLTRQHEGTGLGLAICKRLVERMGGTIEVASEWGKGSTFELILPTSPERRS